MVKNYFFDGFSKIFLYEQHHSANKQHLILDDSFCLLTIFKNILVNTLINYIFSQNFY